MSNSEQIDLLKNYFGSGRNYSDPISYYNAYSAWNLKVKMQLQYGQKVDPQFILLPENLLILIDANGKTFARIIAPENEQATQKACMNFEKDGYNEIFVHYPDFQPDASCFKLQFTYTQIYYDCGAIGALSEIIEKPVADAFLSSRSTATLKKNLKEIEFRKVHSDDLDAIHLIIDQWATKAIERGFSTSGIKKDLNILDFYFDSETEIIGQIGYRSEHPVCFSFATPLKSHADFATLLACKSLNYKSQMGGYNETTICNMINLCHTLKQEYAISCLNTGGNIDGSSLSKFKQRLNTSNREFIVHDYRFAANHSDE